MNKINEFFDFAFLAKNKKKVFIAGISVSYGILMLILLAGTGRGLQSVVKNIFSDYSTKTIEVYAGEASISDFGISKGSSITFTSKDIEIIKNRFSEIDNISPITYVELPFIETNKKRTKRFEILGVESDYFKIKTPKIVKGRLFNSGDTSKNHIVIGEEIAYRLFDTSKCIGEVIFIGAVGFKIIGVITDRGLLENSRLNIYIPFGSALSINGSLDFDEFILKVNKNQNIAEFQKILRFYIFHYRGFNPSDKSAIFLDNFERLEKDFLVIIKSVNFFLWFIGVSFLFSGMLSIFNIMTVIVNDRFEEFGIRKALGATPNSIKNMVLIETLFITIISGGLGLMVGYFTIFLMNTYISFYENLKSFLVLELNFSIVLVSLILLILAGCIAGMIPARRAANILPVDALNKLN